MIHFDKIYFKTIWSINAVFFKPFTCIIVEGVPLIYGLEPLTQDNESRRDLLTLYSIITPFDAFEILCI